MNKSYFSFFCFLSLSFFGCSPNTNEDIINTPVTNSVLCVTDIPNLNIIESKPYVGMFRYQSGVEVNYQMMTQKLKTNDINIHLNYAEYPSIGLAQFISTNKNPYTISASLIKKNPFIEGIWEDAIHQSIGDQMWHYEINNMIDLLVLYETTLIHIGSWGGDMATQKNICEELALKIVEKIRQGGKVLIPDEPLISP